MELFYGVGKTSATKPENDAGDYSLSVNGDKIKLSQKAYDFLELGKEDKAFISFSLQLIPTLLSNSFTGTLTNKYVNDEDESLIEARRSFSKALLIYNATDAMIKSDFRSRIYKTRAISHQIMSEVLISASDSVDDACTMQVVPMTFKGQIKSLIVLE